MVSVFFIGYILMSKKVFLDALINREDFDVSNSNSISQGPHKATLSYNDFEIPGFFFAGLRKPDFQRETNEWTPEKVKDLIASFLDGDLIPAIILWKFGDSFTFVIDGGHRISALAAWVNNDYGDRDVSLKYYESIPEHQLEIAKQTRDLIDKEIGPFSKFKKCIFDPDANLDNDPLFKLRLKNFGTRAIQLQWVDGDSKKAETSFFKINQKSTPISNVEISILKGRRTPVGLASRAIIRGGEGFKYWRNFSQKIAEDIQGKAKTINEILFTPILVTPIKTADLPLAGKNHSAEALSMVHSLVALIANGKYQEDDIDGKNTLYLLTIILKVVRRINDIHPSSLGLHPLVYIYSSDGRFRVSCFLAILKFIIELEKDNRFDEFTKHRNDFEHIILNSEQIITKIVRDSRIAVKSIEPLSEYFEDILLKLKKGQPTKKILSEAMSSFKVIDANKETSVSPNVSKNTKGAVFIRDAIQGIPKCSICNGLMHSHSIQFDHVVRKEDGGLGNFSNIKMAHPYCNTTYKN